MHYVGERAPETSSALSARRLSPFVHKEARSDRIYIQTLNRNDSGRNNDLHPLPDSRSELRQQASAAWRFALLVGVLTND